MQRMRSCLVSELAEWKRREGFDRRGFLASFAHKQIHYKAINKAKHSIDIEFRAGTTLLASAHKRSICGPCTMVLSNGLGEERIVYTFIEGKVSE